MVINDPEVVAELADSTQYEPHSLQTTPKTLTSMFWHSVHVVRFRAAEKRYRSEEISAVRQGAAWGAALPAP